MNGQGFRFRLIGESKHRAYYLSEDGKVLSVPSRLNSRGRSIALNSPECRELRTTMSKDSGKPLVRIPQASTGLLAGRTVLLETALLEAFGKDTRPRRIRVTLSSGRTVSYLTAKDCAVSLHVSASTVRKAIGGSPQSSCISNSIVSIAKR